MAAVRVFAGASPTGSCSFPIRSEGPLLDPEWKWPIGQEPTFHLSDKALTLDVPINTGQVFVARSPLSSAYTAAVGLLPGSTAAGGLAIVGGAHNQIGLSRRGDNVELWRSDSAGRHVMWTHHETFARVLWVRVAVTAHAEASFSFSTDGETWSSASQAISVKNLLPWDQGLRVGLVVDGAAGSSASFVHFTTKADGGEVAH